MWILCFFDLVNANENTTSKEDNKNDIKYKTILSSKQNLTAETITTGKAKPLFTIHKTLMQKPSPDVTTFDNFQKIILLFLMSMANEANLIKEFNRPKLGRHEESYMDDKGERKFERFNNFGRDFDDWNYKDKITYKFKPKNNNGRCSHCGEHNQKCSRRNEQKQEKYVGADVGFVNPFIIRLSFKNKLHDDKTNTKLVENKKIENQENKIVTTSSTMRTKHENNNLKINIIESLDKNEEEDSTKIFESEQFSTPNTDKNVETKAIYSLTGQIEKQTTNYIRKRRSHNVSHADLKLDLHKNVEIKNSILDKDIIEERNLEKLYEPFEMKSYQTDLNTQLNKENEKINKNPLNKSDELDTLIGSFLFDFKKEIQQNIVPNDEEGKTKCNTKRNPIFTVTLPTVLGIPYIL